MTSTRDAVIDAIRTLFPAYEGEIGDATKASEIPGWDSISQVQLMFLIEEQTGKTLDVARTFTLPDVGGLIAYVESL